MKQWIVCVDKLQLVRILVGKEFRKIYLSFTGKGEYRDMASSREYLDFILEQLRLIGFTQSDLIECYERLYKLAEASDSENKEKILATLPEIPASSQE